MVNRILARQVSQTLNKRQRITTSRPGAEGRRVGRLKLSSRIGYGRGLSNMAERQVGLAVAPSKARGEAKGANIWSQFAKRVAPTCEETSAFPASYA